MEKLKRALDRFSGAKVLQSVNGDLTLSHHCERRPWSDLGPLHQKPRFAAPHQQVLEALRYMGKSVLVRHIPELCRAAHLHAIVRIPAGVEQSTVGIKELMRGTKKALRK